MRDIDTWEQTKQRLLTRWPALTEDDLEPTEGRRSELIALLEGRLGYARANAEHDIDQMLEGDRIVPRDVADESNHTGTSSAQPTPSFSAGQHTNGYAPAAEAHAAAGGPYESRAWGGDAMSASSETANTGMAAWPWPAAAGMAALGTLGVTLAMRARRKSQRKHLVIPLPTQAESTQAAEAVGRAAGSGWKYLRSTVALVIGGIAGWGIRRYQSA